MTAQGWYKPGIRWILVDERGEPEYWLQQNPNTYSVFAMAAREGMDIVWVCSELPEPGNVKYTGEVIMNGERMDRATAKWRAVDFLNGKKARVTA